MPKEGHAPGALLSHHYPTHVFTLVIDSVDRRLRRNRATSLRFRLIAVNATVISRQAPPNIRIRNQLAPGTEGGVKRYLPTNEVMSIYEASMKYQADNVPLVVLSGTEYGTGPSRDWAANGTLLLGVKAVITSSYERIHRSNLVGMGILPLEFAEGATWQSLGLTGEEIIDIPDLSNDLQPRSSVTVTATSADGTTKEFSCVVRIDTSVDLQFYQNGGILHTVLRNLSKPDTSA